MFFTWLKVPWGAVECQINLVTYKGLADCNETDAVFKMLDWAIVMKESSILRASSGLIYLITYKG